MLGIYLKRLKNSVLSSPIIIATNFKKDVPKITPFLKKENFNYFQGSIDDVLDHFYEGTKQEQPDFLDRVKSDCPLIDRIIKKTVDNKINYYSNTLVEAYEDGQDIEVFEFSTLLTTWKKAVTKSQREHVTPFVSENLKLKFRIYYR